MSKLSLGNLLAGIGVVALLLIGWKLMVVGYYPDELPLHIVLLLITAAVLWVGDRLRKAAKAETGADKEGGE